MRPCMARHRLGRILIAVVLTAATCVAASADSDLEGPVLVPSFPSIGSRFEAETDTGYPSPETTEPVAPPENDVEDPSDDDAPPRADADDATATTADETGDSSTADADTANNDAVAPETNGDAGKSESPAKELPTDADASAEDDSSSEAETAPAEPETPPKPRRELTPAMAQLRDRVRRTLGTHHGHLLGTDGNSVTEIIYACRAFGCDTNVREVNSLGKVLNGITCLCWNYPCAGFTPLLMADGHITGRIGYGCQEQPGQLIATLALARVQDSYPLRVGEDTRTVADLVEYEKLACRASIDKSLSMIGLMYYAGSDGEWENRLGEPWSIERVLREELDKPIIGAPFGGTQRLMGLSYVVDRRTKRHEPIDGQYARTQRYIQKFHDHALRLQNEDGTWNGRYFAARGTSRQAADQLAATSRILEWLVFSLPEEKLDDARVVRGIHWLDQMLSRGRYGHNAKSLSTAEIASVMHGLHALRLYDHRYFKPADEAGREEGDG